MSSLDAVFYPQIVCLNETLLKYILLVFDRITFLPTDIDLPSGHDSVKTRFSINDDILFSAFGTKAECLLSGMYSSESKYWNDEIKRLMDTYDYLESIGVCIPIKDMDFSDAKRWHPLKPFVDADVSNTVFVDLCRSAMNRRLIISGNPNAEIKGGGFVTRPFEYKGDNAFAALCSQRINSVLYFAGNRNLVPMSNHDFFIQLLRLKLESAAKNDEYNKDTNIPGQLRKSIMGLLSYEIATEAIPSGTLEKKSIKQILTYKDACSESQDRFRKRLFALEAKLEEAAWDNDFRVRISRLVRSEILPEIDNVRESKRIIWEKLFGETVKVAFSTKVVTSMSIAASFVFAPLPYLDALRYSAVGLAATTALSSLLPKLVDSALEERQRRRHSLFYVANFK